jgi:hypothetical protein
MNRDILRGIYNYFKFYWQFFSLLSRLFSLEGTNIENAPTGRANYWDCPHWKTRKGQLLEVALSQEGPIIEAVVTENWKVQKLRLPLQEALTIEIALTGRTNYWDCPHRKGQLLRLPSLEGPTIEIAPTGRFKSTVNIFNLGHGDRIIKWTQVVKFKIQTKVLFLMQYQTSFDWFMQA